MALRQRPPTLLVCAGESSGDFLGAAVVRELRRSLPDLEVFGLGGDSLAAEGTDLFRHVRDLSIVGFAEVFRQFPRFKVMSWKFLDEVERRHPDAALLVDYPGFNLQMAAEFQRMRIPVAWYVAPKVWVWRRHRIQFLRGRIEKMLVLFRFEEEIWRAGGVPVTFVGHPAGDFVRPAPDRAAFLAETGLDPARPVLALLPGSRRSEVGYMLTPLLAAAAELVRRDPSLQPLVALAPNLDPGVLALPPGGPPVRVVRDRTHEALGASRLALVACGTAALEAALLGVPNVVVYRTDPFTYWWGRRVTSLTRFALPNILTGRDVVAELIQDDMTPARIVEAALPLLADGEPRRRMLEEFAEVRREIGAPGASARAAAEVLRIIETKVARRTLRRIGTPDRPGTPSPSPRPSAGA